MSWQKGRVFTVTVAKNCPGCGKPVTDFRYGTEGIVTTHTDKSPGCLVGPPDLDKAALVMMDDKGKTQ